MPSRSRHTKKITHPEALHVEAGPRRALPARRRLTTVDARTIRLALTVDYAFAEIASPAAPARLQDAVDRLVERASREFVAALTLNELLDAKDALIQFVQADVGPKARRLGVVVRRVGVHDVILPREPSRVGARPVRLARTEPAPPAARTRVASS